MPAKLTWNELNKRANGIKPKRYALYLRWWRARKALGLETKNRDLSQNEMMRRSK